MSDEGIFFLSFNSERRTPWTGHDAFPKGAVKHRDKEQERFKRLGYPDRPIELRIYQSCMRGCHLTEIPEKDWAFFL